MDPSSLANLAPPRFEDGKLLLIAGSAERYNSDNCVTIAAQWQRFGEYFGKVPGQVSNVAYGVCYNTDDTGNFDYLCGVEVTDFSNLPATLTRMRLPQQRYAVFPHREHIAIIRRTWMTIWAKWLPESGHTPADAPSFERYSEQFDPVTGLGGVEVWLPLKT